MAKRILIADDSVTIQKAFAMTFGAEDVALLAARSADEGLNVARQARPDLVIADAAMPGRSGYDLCAAVKSDPTLRGVPVYILSSSQNPYDELRGRQSGADGHFIKPFDSGVMIERAAEAIAKGPSAAASSIGSGAFAVPAATVSRPSGAVPARPAAAPVPAPPPRAADGDDSDYGEISIEGPAGAAAPEPARAPAFAFAPSAPPAAAPLGRTTGPLPAQAPPLAAPGGMRPSLIPGIRPGTLPGARPGGMSMPMRPVAAPLAAPSPLAAPRPPGAAPPAAVGHTRTAVGMNVMGGMAPAARSGVMSVPASPLRPAGPSPVPSVRPYGPMSPVAPPGAVPGGPPAAVVVGGPSPAFASAITSAVDQKMAAFAARGPEYEAIAKLSREIIEKVVWEVVPELAEVIVREELQRRGRI